MKSSSPFIHMLAAMLLATFGALHAEQESHDGEARRHLRKHRAGSLRLDLHYPAAPKAGVKHPLVVFMHGGGWSAGNKTIGDGDVRFMGLR